MAVKTMKLRAKGSALVYNVVAQEADVKRFIGKAFQQVSAPGEEPVRWGFVSTGDEEVPFHNNYRVAVKEGDLWPADEATAAMCGVNFDPAFGGDTRPVKAFGGKEPMPASTKGIE